jgi:hypothetical protein
MVSEEILEQLQRRCESASRISLEEYEEGADKHWWVVTFPRARGEQKVYLGDESSITRLLSVPFERYVFLEEYTAICSYEDKVIEAIIRYPTAYPFLTYRRLLGRTDQRMDNREDWTIELIEEGGEGRVKIGPSSDVFYALRNEEPPPNYGHYVPTILIEGIKISQHDQALELLRRVADSLLLQIDLSLGLLLSLDRTREPLRYTTGTSFQRTHTVLQFPQNEYDKEPMALYWYARNASGMPLLQFLAYYQAIEFYFPVYSQIEAHKRIRNILKDPAFRRSRDADIGRILSVVGASNSRHEPGQLKATLRECVDPDELRQFIASNEERKNFLALRTEDLTDCKIQSDNTKADLLNDVAERIYDIRCKIVHTKGDAPAGKGGFLLPFSREAALLHFDIELVQYIATQVLIAASSPFHI